MPAGTEAVAGETIIEVSAGASTFSEAEPLIVPEVAVTVAVPCAVAVATPAALTLAPFTALQVAEVKVCVLPSV